MYRQSPTELKSAISTMKVILLFALFGLSFCQDACPVKPVSDPDADNCLIKALKDVSGFLPALGEFVCAYNQFQVDNNKVNYEAAVKELAHLLECVGCHLGDVLGDPYLVALFKGIGEAGSESSQAVVDLLASLKLDQTTFTAVCTVGGKLLKSKCLEEALRTDATGAVKDLTALYCQLNKDGATGAAANIVNIVKRLPCVLNELGLTDLESLELSLGALSQEHLQGLVGELLLLTGKVPVVSSALCLLVSLECIPL
ncbi:ranaspumin-like [Lithobates pipiens]